MSIVGLDEATLTAESIDEARRYLTDYGLVEAPADGGYPLFVAMDNTGLRVAPVDAVDLPPAVAPGPNVRDIVWGVTDTAALDRLAQELSRDREVRRDGALLRTTDVDGNSLAFRVTRRKPLPQTSSLVNMPGMPPQRPVNSVQDFNSPIRPLTFSHLVLYTPDLERLQNDYTNRLGFWVTDRFTGAGAFLRAPGHNEHHQLFFIQDAQKRGLNHLAFHVRDHTAMMLAGKAFADKGWTPAWGPGRHIFGGNCFWYFKSPFGGNVEFDADMDIVDENWVPREAVMGPNTAAAWLTTLAVPAKH
jgi:catechol 2,3-dioxygenase-like lactoylglutathione lyase family enzyme